ncbi:MAG: BREX-6 system adenine-specific DNA-methyltransferase PglX [Myxococcota bacterium]|nr:BREX-6 system adenine-specific DNA-methyltransferase PglX [Myxococcota bacterium]
MTPDAKRLLSKTIRELRERIIKDLRDATARAYLLSIVDAKKATLSEAARAKRARLEAWLREQTRSVPAKERPAARDRLFGELIKDAAATLLQRIVYLRLIEANKLRPRVVIGGWNSPEYKAFREIAPDLVVPDKSGGKLRDDSDGYTTLLQLIFDELALDLPGLFGPVRMTSLVPVPAATLRSIITAFDDADLESVWTDDTTLGWIYQYWNDPEREALDAKLAAQKKLENHEIASKTQMFTERYMVEWLLHNSLGQLWLAMCKKHGWTADVQRDDRDGSVLDRLDARRADWRRQREAGEVALDALMPIAPGLEDRWKYWVPQPMPDDAVTSAPDSVRTIKLLDPACGSGHFLVIAFELLFHLHKEEARHRGEVDLPESSDQAIVESILEHNLHGIDIDPRAVQIAAAALMLKAKLTCKDAELRTLNLVAPALSLAQLPVNDPALRALYAAVENETGIPPALTSKIIAALAGADHLGSLLKVDAEIDAGIAEWDEKLSKIVSTKDDQGSLFTGFGPRRRKRITAEHAKATLLSQLERFLAHHSRGADLGLRLRGEQLAAGVRFVRMIREGQYDLVVGNPPYQGTSKMADKRYIEQHYPRGKADLYAAFIMRGLQLVRDGGISALLTMRNWMFIKQFSALREWLLHTFDLRMNGDFDRGAFDEVPNEVLAVEIAIVRKASPSSVPSVAVQPTPLDDKSYDRERTMRKRAAVLCQVGRSDFAIPPLFGIPQCPLVYWWSDSEISAYRNAAVFGESAPGDVPSTVESRWRSG